MQQSAASILAMGGVGSAKGYRALQRLNAEAITKGLSPGGSADMLAMSIFIAIFMKSIRGLSKKLSKEHYYDYNQARCTSRYDGIKRYSYSNRAC